ncbi:MULTISPECIES: IS66 family insertion sequence element accessory protein TnpB [Bradyrhizobium]|uniref:IS66 family insertion sequence element accessory protein TnpB n=1 Tax=Bradyrhizobium TaxID=374 RepID=UPI001E2ACA0F|nr:MULTISPECIES: IS66 family insertion sequence element accessory protein TnpB [Bradyrhizobium]
MIALRSDLKVVLAAQPVDFRKSIHTLSALVSEAPRANPYCGDVFVFRSKRMDRVKLLAWDDSSMVLVTKWLHQGRFTWPPIRDGAVHLGVDACLTQACEAAGRCWLRGEDFAGAWSGRTYRLIMAIRPDALPTDPAALTEMMLALDVENEKLRVAMQTLKEMIFGKRSERLAVIVAAQLALELGDLETDATTLPAPTDDSAPATKPSDKPRKKAHRNIGALPKHLPRCEQVLEPAATACPCCQGRLHKIGEDVSEVLDVIPAMLRVLRTIRPKYACHGCTDGVVQAKALPRLVEGGMVSTALVAHVVVSKFAWYLPLYRQVQILAGQGIHLDRATLANLVKRAAWWLKSLYELQLRTIQASPRLFCVETPMPVLDPGRHRTRICQFLGACHG